MMPASINQSQIFDYFEVNNYDAQGFTYFFTMNRSIRHVKRDVVRRNPSFQYQLDT